MKKTIIGLFCWFALLGMVLSALPLHLISEDDKALVEVFEKGTEKNKEKEEVEKEEFKILAAEIGAANRNLYGLALVVFANFHVEGRALDGPDSPPPEFV